MNGIGHFDFLNHWHFNFLINGKLFCVMMMNCVDFVGNFNLDKLMMTKSILFKFIHHKIIEFILFTNLPPPPPQTTDSTKNAINNTEATARIYLRKNINHNAFN